MSLINDALRRAKEAQRQAPPPESTPPQFRPVEPEQATVRRVGLAMPITLALVALLVLFFVWQVFKKGDANAPNPEMVVRATAPPASSPTALPPGIPVPAPPPPGPPVSQPLAFEPAPGPAAPTAAQAVAAQEGQPTNVPVVLDPQPPQQAPLRLQGRILLLCGRSIALQDCQQPEPSPGHDNN